MLFTTDPSGPSSRSLAIAGRPAGSHSAGSVLRRAVSRFGLARFGVSGFGRLRFGRRPFSLAPLWRSRHQSKFRPDEAGDTTLRDLGLDSGSQSSPYHLVDIDPAMESTRMRLFAMTGSYWRGS